MYFILATLYCNLVMISILNSNGMVSCISFGSKNETNKMGDTTDGHPESQNLLRNIESRLFENIQYTSIDSPTIDRALWKSQLIKYCHGYWQEIVHLSDLIKRSLSSGFLNISSVDIINNFNCEYAECYKKYNDTYSNLTNLHGEKFNYNEYKNILLKCNDFVQISQKLCITNMIIANGLLRDSDKKEVEDIIIILKKSSDNFIYHLKNIENHVDNHLQNKNVTNQENIYSNPHFSIEIEERQPILPVPEAVSKKLKKTKKKPQPILPMYQDVPKKSIIIEKKPKIIKSHNSVNCLNRCIFKCCCGTCIGDCCWYSFKLISFILLLIILVSVGIKQFINWLGF